MLNNVNYEFDNNGLYFLVGPSGCGKTTLLNIIAGIIKPTKGSVIYKDLKNINLDSYYSFQDFNLFSKLSVLESIKLIFNIKNKQYDEKLVLDILEELNILNLKNKMTNELSGGERQRVSIAVALSLKSKVLLLDEPTASLDEKNSINIFNIIRKISKDILIIVSTHDLSLLNENDNVVDLTKLEHKSIENIDLNAKKHKKIYLNIKSLFHVNKLMSKQYIRFFIQSILICVFLITGSFLIPLMNVNCETVNAHDVYINNSYIISKCKPDFSSDYKCSTLLNPSFGGNYGYIYINDSLSDFKINVTNCKNVYTTYTKPYNYRLGDEIKVNNYSLEVEKVNDVTDSLYTWLQDCQRNVGLNHRTYSLISSGIYIDDDNYYNSAYNNVYAKANNDLRIGEIIVSKRYALAKNLNIGDKTNLKFKYHQYFKGNVEMNFVIKNIVEADECYISSNDFLNLSDASYQKNDFYSNDNSDYFIYYDFKNEKTALNLLYKIKNAGYEYVCPNYDNIKMFSSWFVGMAKVLKFAAPVAMFLVLLITFYLSYNLLKMNQHDFYALELLGVSKNSLFLVIVLDTIKSFFLSIILSIYPLMYFDKKLIEDVKESAIRYLSFDINYNFFQFKYFALSSLIIFIILIAFSYLIIISKNNKKTFLN